MSPRPAARSLVALALLAAPLAACSGQEIERDFGLVRDAPDEYTVTTRAPLSMPPDAQLATPQPGAPRPQEQSTRTQALEALAPDVALQGAAGTESPGQTALVQAAGASAAATDQGRAGPGARARPGRGGGHRAAASSTS